MQKPGQVLYREIPKEYDVIRAAVPVGLGLASLLYIYSSPMKESLVLPPPSDEVWREVVAGPGPPRAGGC